MTGKDGTNSSTPHGPRGSQEEFAKVEAHASDDVPASNAKTDDGPKNSTNQNGDVMIAEALKFEGDWSKVGTQKEETHKTMPWSDPKQSEDTAKLNKSSDDVLKPAMVKSSDEVQQLAAKKNSSKLSVLKSKQKNVSALKKKASPKISNKKQRRKKRKMTREKLQEGDHVKSERYMWKVDKLLGSGGFGDVYKVHKIKNADNDKHEYAMKTEMVEGDERLLRLKIEVSVLKQCWEQEDNEIRKHFVEFVDRGITKKFKFMVMGLVGPSLEDIRRKYLDKSFTKPTVLNTAIQTLKALANLHSLGWLHRDIKPQNYAVGLGKKEDTIFLLDFGIAKKIFNEGTKCVKVPRSKVKFLGTPRFASRACHYGKEQGRKDDLETWLYMIYDLFDDEHGLQWKHVSDKKELVSGKEKFFTHAFTKCYRVVPKEFKAVVDTINRLGYADEPDYKSIEDVLHLIGKNNSIKIDKKLDWIGKLHKPKKDEANRFSSSTSSDNLQSGSDDSESSTEESKKKRTKKKKRSSKKKH